MELQIIRNMIHEIRSVYVMIDLKSQIATSSWGGTRKLPLMLPNLTTSKSIFWLYTYFGYAQQKAEQSRWDETLLTVDFNLRKQETTCIYVYSSWEYTYIGLLPDYIVSSLCDLGDTLFYALRRLKSTVNKVSSLRDLVAEHSRSMPDTISGSSHKTL